MSRLKKNKKIFDSICILLLCFMVFSISCKKPGNSSNPPPPPASFSFNGLKVNGVFNGLTYYGVNTYPITKFSFSHSVNRSRYINLVAVHVNRGSSFNYNPNNRYKHEQIIF